MRQRKHTTSKDIFSIEHLNGSVSFFSGNGVVVCAVDIEVILKME